MPLQESPGCLQGVTIKEPCYWAGTKWKAWLIWTGPRCATTVWTSTVLDLLNSLGRCMNWWASKDNTLIYAWAEFWIATATQGQARPGKTRQGKARQSQTRPGKARPGKARQGKAKLWCSVDRVMIPFWYRYDSDVISMRYRCDTDVLSMWYRRGADVALLWHWCVIDVLPLRHRCDTDATLRWLEWILCACDVIPVW